MSMRTNKEQASRRKFLRSLSIAVPAVGGSFVASSAMTLGDDGKDIKPNDVQDRPGSVAGAIDCDLMVYGATSAGVIAAYTARMYGLKVLLVEPGRHLGGLSSGGLGKTDTGNESAITGLSQEFYIRVGQYYGKMGPSYRFEPHVAERIFTRYIDEAGVEVLFSRRVKNVDVNGSRIRSVQLEYSGADAENSILTITASNFIDATYEGDLLARAGVSYTVGREGNSVYNEKYNGVIPASVLGPYGSAKRNPDPLVEVDPYVVPGKPSSGLIPEIQGIGHAAPGTGDKKVQAYCFRLCLTQDKDNQLPLSEPDRYDPARYELMARLQKRKPWSRLREGFIISEMPRGKTDWNNWGLVGFSSDYIGGNWDYPDADYEDRSRIWDEHIEYQKGLLWFLATDERIPGHIRKEMNTWGYCRDEFLDTGGWPHQLYVREARRMLSDFVMTEHHCIGTEPVRDGIAMGAYGLDSHCCQRVVVSDHVENEGLMNVSGFPPYPISYRSMIPKREEITNLIVPVCVSASHASYGSIRMEPVFMALGQAAGIAAFHATRKNKSVQDIDGTTVQEELRKNPLPNRKVPVEYSRILPFRG
jgi:hypothetical protein